MAHHAGGDAALISASEDAEDSEELGVADAAEIAPVDLVVGIAASGRTPYVAGALRGARERGAATVLVSCNPAAPLAEFTDVHIAPDTGPEAIAGSTRLKAGTATKLVLNAFSTALMVRLGRTYSNLMVSVVATNSKLRGRMITILCEATAEPEERVRAALGASEGDLKTALVSILGDCSPERARAALHAAGGVVRIALDELPGDARHIRVRATAPRASKLVVGLDAGGTGSRIRLTSTDGSGRVTDGTGPGVHVRDQGVDLAALIHGLTPALRDLERRAGPDGAAAAAVGLAGLPGLVSDLAPLHQALAGALGVRRTVVASDAVTALVGAHGLRPGVVIAAGTGVIALGTDFAATWRRVDGWAHLLGDDGGGAWIGMRGLRAGMRAYDRRRGGSSDLLEQPRNASVTRSAFPSASIRARIAPDCLRRSPPTSSRAREPGTLSRRRSCARQGYTSPRPPRRPCCPITSRAWRSAAACSASARCCWRRCARRSRFWRPARSSPRRTDRRSMAR